MATICWVGQDGSLGRLETDAPWPPGAPSPAPEGATVIAEIQWDQMLADRATATGQPTGTNTNPFG